ncbi:MAG: hypothetical protein ABI882_11530 [Acidobacteriota bacterium]
MRIRARREILVGLQYLLIGIIAEIGAEVAVNRWFPGSQGDIVKQVVGWSLIAIALGLVRLVIIVLASVLRRDQWQSISRRNWI